MEDSDSSGSSDSTSTEEERLRRLFMVCDRDKDGLIDCEDLRHMCQLLHVKESVDEIMSDLGVEKHRLISFEEFIRCRKQFTDELQAVEDTEDDQTMAIVNPDLCNNARDVESLEAVNYNFPSLFELFEYHEPKLLRSYLKLSSTNQQTIKDLDILEVANSLHLTALSSLKGEIIDLSNLLKHTKAEKVLLEKQLAKHQVEKLRTQKDAEDRFDQQMTRYEDRITELHGVIAELKRKLDQWNIRVIQEEDECEESDGVQSNKSNKDGSIYDNTPTCSNNASTADVGLDLNVELSRVVSEMESAIDEHHRLAVSSHDIDKDKGLTSSSNKEEKGTQVHSTEGGSLPMGLSGGLEKRVSDLELLNQSLEELSRRHRTEIDHLRSRMGEISDENERLKQKMEKIQLRGQSMEVLPSSLTASSQKKSLSSSEVSRSKSLISSTGASVSMAKVAELKKLKTGKCDIMVLGADISSLGLPNSKVAEHLVHSMQENSSLQEMIQLMQKRNGAETECCELPMVKIHEFEIERERLQSKVDNLSAQIDLLNITLSESKGQCDRLTVLLGKYESNNTALKISLNYSDQALEVYDAIISLLDVELALLLTRCRATDHRNLNGQNSASVHQNVIASRRAVEIAARQLLLRLDQTNIKLAGAVSPWEDSPPTSRTDSMTSSTASTEEAEFTKSDEMRLREHLHQLKADRNVVKLTILELESVHLDPSYSDLELCPDAQRLDLENAVLVQELMAMKEEKSELKAQNFLLEKEKAVLELNLKKNLQQKRHLTSAVTSPAGQLVSVNEASNKECMRILPDDITKLKFVPPFQDAADDDLELPDVLRREARLQARVLELTTAMENLSRNSDAKHQQSAGFVNELKKANSALVCAFEKTKKKYLDKVKKMEIHVQNTTEHYEMQMKLMRQKLKMSENELQQRNLSRPFPPHASKTKECS